MAGASPYNQYQYPIGHQPHPYGHQSYVPHIHGQAAYDPNAYYHQQQYAQQYSQHAYAAHSYDTSAYTHGVGSQNDQYGTNYPPAKRQRASFQGAGRGRGGGFQHGQHPYATYPGQEYSQGYAQGYGQGRGQGYNQAYTGYGGYPHSGPGQQYPHPYPTPQATAGWTPPQNGWQAPPPQAYPGPSYPTQQYSPPQHYPHPSAMSAQPPSHPGPPGPQSYQPQHSMAWHAGQPHTTSNQGPRPVPISASSKQWRKPKTPPEQKEDASSAKPGSMPPPDLTHRTSSVASGSTQLKTPMPAADQPPKAQSSNQAVKAVSKSAPSSNPYPGLDYLGEDDDDHWYDGDQDSDQKLSLGSIMWYAPKPVSSALPSDYFEASEQIKQESPMDSPSPDISQYVKPGNMEEQIKSIRNTEHWVEVKDDPIFRDLSKVGALVPFTQLNGFRSRVGLSQQQHRALQGALNGERIDGSSSAYALGSALHQSRVNESIAKAGEEASAEKCQASKEDDEDDEPYSPPPPELTPVVTPQPKAANNPHKRKFSALETIVEEEISPQKPSTNGNISFESPSQPRHYHVDPANVQDVISTIEHQSADATDVIQARIEAITNAKQIEADNQHAQEANIQARIEAITNGQASAGSPPPVKPPQRRKSSVHESQQHAPRRNSLPPKEFARDQSQEDVLAKLGVTGDAKPVFTTPAPARSDPPPEYEPRSRSRSRSQSPVKR
ncbi:MAG: hypothetical protein Q9159_005990, partial [Coniocarpon cinnabarinum]